MQISVEQPTHSTEFLAEILTLYRADLTGEAVGGGAPHIDTARVKSLFREAHQFFKRRRQGGDSLANAIMALTASEWDESEITALTIGASIGIDASTTSLAPESLAPESSGSVGLGQRLYDLAVADFENGRVARAAVLLAILTYAGVDVANALAGLAVCGTRLNNFDAALVLATECLRLSVKHPRAYFVAGLCEFQRGNRKVAQSLLATAARFARQRPEFRADMHAAQRLLLILHFG